MAIYDNGFQMQYNGITLNNQDIDLMLIANSNDLEEVLKIVTNIKTTINKDVDIEEERQRIFNLYMKSLTSRVDYYINPSILLVKKIAYLMDSGVLNVEEKEKINEIISSSNNRKEIMDRLELLYRDNPDKLHQIYETIRDYTPIEKTGVIGTTIEAYKNLFNLIRNNYNSITIDEEGKYGAVTLPDGTFSFKHLAKSLEFAKLCGKQVRLNAFIFYMDCPEYLYELPKSEENKQLVKQKLTDYIVATTNFINQNGYADVVRSCDVFNELLNRFSMSGESPYQYRGDINQDESLYTDFDNVKSGWLKHLDIEDLCDVIAEARKRLPNVDFMFNDDNLTDQKKIVANHALLLKIRNYEETHDVILINSIGTQMHIDNSTTKEEIENMFNSLAQYNLPIEITEFDMAMTSSVESLSDEEIEYLRNQKLDEILTVIDSLTVPCNIRGFTIWSKTDRQNFRVSLANEYRIKHGMSPIESLHGGMFNDDMQPKDR